MTANGIHKAVATRAEVIETLRNKTEAIRALGATELYLFGSAARDELRADSDVDLFIDYDVARPPTLFDLAGLEIMLSNLLGRSVEVSTRRSLHPRLRATIEAESVRVA